MSAFMALATLAERRTGNSGWIDVVWTFGLGLTGIAGALLPFGAGPRICIGATFAMQEAIIALGVLMHRFRFDMTKETRPWPVQRLTTQPANGLALRVTARPPVSSPS